MMKEVGVVEKGRQRVEWRTVNKVNCGSNNKNENCESDEQGKGWELREWRMVENNERSG